MASDRFWAGAASGFLLASLFFLALLWVCR